MPPPREQSSHGRSNIPQSTSREGYQPYPPSSTTNFPTAGSASQPAEPPPKPKASKYTNLQEEKAKVTKLLEEYERKQRLEKELRMQQAHVFKSAGKEPAPPKMFESQSPEQLEYVRQLLRAKPWLSCLPLRASKLEYLKKTYPLDESAMCVVGFTGKDLEDFQAEVDFVNEEVNSKRNMPREKKSDYELLMDARYFSKYGDYLFKRIEAKTFYSRLGKSVTNSV